MKQFQAVVVTKERLGLQRNTSGFRCDQKAVEAWSRSFQDAQRKMRVKISDHFIEERER